MKVEIDVSEVRVIRTSSTDKIVVSFEGDPLYPNWLPLSCREKDCGLKFW